MVRLVSRAGTKWFVTAVLLVVIGLAASGCGGSSTSGDGSASTGPIKVGVAVALSGFYAGDGQNSLQGIEMGINEINAAGGLNGRKLEMVKFDLQDLAPERVALAADTLIGQEKCDVVFAGWAGFGGDIQAFGKYTVPFFHDDAQQACVDVMNKGGYKNIWQTVDTEANVGADQWSFLMSLDYNWPNKKVAFIHSDDNWAANVYDAIDKAAKAEGWEVVSRDKVPYGTTQWASIMTKVRSSNPALVMFDMMSATDMMTFVNEFKKNPSDSVVSLGMGLSIREFQETAKGTIDGFVGQTGLACGYPIPVASKAEKAWSDAFTKQFSVAPGGLSASTYTGVRAWAQAVEAGGDPSNYDAVNEWLANNEFTVWDDMPTYKFDVDHTIRNADSPLGFGQQQGDKLHTLWFGEPGYKDYEGNTYTFATPSWIK